MTLNPDQRKAAEAILAHCRSGGGPILLTGWAGTGKTTLAAHIAAQVSGEVVGLAFHQAAARALSKALPYPTFTMEQFLGADPVGYAVDGQPTHHYGQRLEHGSAPSFLVVDDVSGLATETHARLLDMLLGYASQHGICTLLLADPDHLPPDQPEGRSVFPPDTPRVQLERVERTRMPDLLDLAAHLRTHLEDSDPLDAATPNWVSRDRSGWQYTQAEYFPGLSAVLGDAPILAFSDAAVERHNRSARRYLKGRLGIPPFDAGDLVIGYHDRNRLPGDPSTHRLMKAWTYEVESRSERSQLHAIPGYWVDLRNRDDNTQHQVFVVPSAEDLSRRMFARRCTNRYDRARKQVEQTGDASHWQSFHAWRDAFVLLGHAADLPHAHKDLDFAYALPVQHTQGHTFNYVLIDGQDLEQVRQQQGDACANRLLYTAVTRARKGVLIGK